MENPGLHPRLRGSGKGGHRCPSRRRRSTAASDTAGRATGQGRRQSCPTWNPCGARMPGRVPGCPSVPLSAGRSGEPRPRTHHRHRHGNGWRFLHLSNFDRWTRRRRWHGTPPATDPGTGPTGETCRRMPLTTRSPAAFCRSSRSGRFHPHEMAGYYRRKTRLFKSAFHPGETWGQLGYYGGDNSGDFKG